MMAVFLFLFEFRKLVYSGKQLVFCENPYQMIQNNTKLCLINHTRPLWTLVHFAVFLLSKKTYKLNIGNLFFETIFIESQA